MCRMLILWSELSLGRWLLYGDILAGAVAGAGIIWETMKGGESFERIAQRCVIWGVVAETLFSVCLFFVEDAASAIANGNAAIAIERASTLEKQAADLTAENLKIREQMAPRQLLNVSRESLWRLCFGASLPFADLKPFSGTSVKIQVVPDFEAIEFAADLSALLTCLRWKPVNVEAADTGMEPIKIKAGVLIYFPTDDFFDKEKENPLRDAARALAKALTDHKIERAFDAIFLAGHTQGGPSLFWPCCGSPCSDIFILVGVKPRQP